MRILSGIQTSGDLHIGNYLGAVKQWVEHQNNMQMGDEYLFMLADLHAMTVSYKPEDLRRNIFDVTAWFIALGLDPKKIDIFKQSDNPDHAYLSWIFNCITPMGWLERMTQYKDKSSKNVERASVGLFAYPNLMAADILLYDADEVPVGNDQAQHVELANDIVKRFNTTFGEVLKAPRFRTQKEFTRIASLQDPTKKMSKSDPQQNGVIRLIDDADTIRHKIKTAVTDSGSEIKYDPENKPAISNLLAIYSGLSGMAIADIEKKHASTGYGAFKDELADVVITFLKPVQERHKDLSDNPEEVYSVLRQGAEKATSISNKKILEIQKAVGLSL